MVYSSRIAEHVCPAHDSFLMESFVRNVNVTGYGRSFPSSSYVHLAMPSCSLILYSMIRPLADLGKGSAYSISECRPPPTPVAGQRLIIIVSRSDCEAPYPRRRVCKPFPCADFEAVRSKGLQNSTFAMRWREFKRSCALVWHDRSLDRTTLSIAQTLGQLS
jgi:hypothetical protein